MHFSLFLYVSVNKVEGLSHLQPNGRWTNSNIRYHIEVDCTICCIQIRDWGDSICQSEWCYGENGEPYHVYLRCPYCQQYGGLKILRRGGRQIMRAGEEVAVMEVKVVGLFWLHKKASIGGNWICRKNDGSSVEPFFLNDNGDYVFWDSDTEDWLEIRGVKACFRRSQRMGNLHGHWVVQKPWPDSDSDFDSSSDGETDLDSD